MHEVDAEPGAEADQKIAPRLLGRAAKIEASDFAARVFLELPVVAERDQ